MKSVFFISALCLSLPTYAADNAVDTLLKGYQATGAQNFSADAGKTMWSQTFTIEGQERACTSCHGDNVSEPGKHAKTGKSIDALAPSVNPKRLTDTKEIEKWFLRNCKWTVGRECTPQEKGDFLVFLREQ